MGLVTGLHFGVSGSLLRRSSGFSEADRFGARRDAAFLASRYAMAGACSSDLHAATKR